MDCFVATLLAMTVEKLLRRPSEQQQIAVGTPDDEIPGAPRLPPQRLKKRHARRLKREASPSLKLCARMSGSVIWLKRGKPDRIWAAAG
jgi:hypothetical protein